MPIYEYHCEACDKSFDTMTTMSSRDAQIPCPHCNSKKTARKLSVVAVVNGGGAQGNAAPSGGHVHSGMCGCGKRQGSCGMN